MSTDHVLNCITVILSMASTAGEDSDLIDVYSWKPFERIAVSRKGLSQIAQ